MKRDYFKWLFFLLLGLFCVLEREVIVWFVTCSPNFSKKATIRDNSTEKRNVTKIKNKVHLVCYASGNEVNFRNQNTLLQSAINMGFDDFHLYNEKHLDQAFKDKNKHILEQKRGAGYWLWKPYVILDTLKRSNDGDIIIYLDSGVMLDKSINHILMKLESISSDIVLMENGHDNTQYVKRDLMKYFNMDTEEYRKKIHIDAAFMVFRNSETARAFVTEWLRCCEDESLLTDIPSKAEEYPEFKENRHDQAILTLLSYKNHNLVQVVPTTFMEECYHHHRRRERKKDFSLFNNSYSD